ncbi:MAG: nitrate reductase [Helicobacteraceae bacterium]|nr:nitrate reductase [Helicobacteraceae bacterium]
MTTLSKLTISLAAVLLMAGCTGGVSPSKSGASETVSEESLGLRKTNLYTEDTTTGDKTSYGKEYAGSGYKIKRAFQDAPPMIPHDIEGMLPITIKDNQCISCHMPEVAASMGATPVPVSHFTNFRADTAIAKNGKITKSGIEIENTSTDKMAHVSIIKKDQLVGARFNCTQCHAPQSTGKLAVENTFEAQYQQIDGAEKSSWNGKEFMKGLDTEHGK